MATRLVVMSPRPGRITHPFDLHFCRHFFATRVARAVQSSTESIAMREQAFDIIRDKAARARSPPGEVQEDSWGRGTGG